MKFSSLVTVKVETVKAASEAVIKAVELDRSRRLDKAVQTAMNPRLLWFIPLPKRSYEKAEQWVRNNSDGYDDWRWASWRDKGDARRLRDACKVAEGEFMYLSAEDAAFISQYADGAQ